LARGNGGGKGRVWGKIAAESFRAGPTIMVERGQRTNGGGREGVTRLAHTTGEKEDRLRGEKEELHR